MTVRSRTNALRSTELIAPMLCVQLTWTSSLTLLLIAFCCWRLWAIADWPWPMPFPYPDHVLSWLNDRYDSAFPVTDGYIKIHGELDRVRWTLWFAALPPLMVGLSSAAMFLLHYRFLVRPGSQREWLLLALSAGIWIVAWSTRGPTLAYLVLQFGFGIALGFVIWAVMLLSGQYTSD